MDARENGCLVRVYPPIIRTLAEQLASVFEEFHSASNSHVFEEKIYTENGCITWSRRETQQTCVRLCSEESVTAIPHGDTWVITPEPPSSPPGAPGQT